MNLKSLCWASLTVLKRAGSDDCVEARLLILEAKKEPTTPALKMDDVGRLSAGLIGFRDQQLKAPLQ